jgi:hypothetical protein
MLRICKSTKTRKKIQKMVQKLAKPFLRILGWTFLGDVLNNPFWQFRRDGAESFAADRWSKSWQSRFCEFLVGRFWGMF